MKTYKIINIRNSTTVVVNIGSMNGNISKNDHFLIYELGDELFDPDTKESLGKLEIIKGKVTPIHIQDKMTTMQSYELVKQPEKIVEKTNTRLGLAMSFLGDTIEKEKTIVEKIKELTNVKIGDLVKKI